eukprot:CAMPEP_0183608368 /NCGR_PEP_ID=MMETSP0371-20130417/183926_1 /TAXON_ID=268820 /ORGANISM="Peridinium aciculiferum, Strain PAER-2" /LENGTH=298 /DNA_ID=CAMNT_0025820495 /DNA_START=97 /DNA_END=993 /DNA_ORIENTATION=-
MALRILVRMFRIADAMSSQMFSSTYFILSLSPRHATISFTGTTTYAKTDLTCVATLTVLNHRFNIMQNTQDVPFPAPKPVPLEFTEFLASSASGSPDTDLAPAAAEAAAVEAGKGTDPGMQQTMCWLSNVDAKEAVSFSHELAHAHICCLSLQQHIELRLRSRQCMRLFSSLVLLWTNIVLGAHRVALAQSPVHEALLVLGVALDEHRLGRIRFQLGERSRRALVKIAGPLVDFSDRDAVLRHCRSVLYVAHLPRLVLLPHCGTTVETQSGWRSTLLAHTALHYVSCLDEPYFRAAHI